jgi:WD40 repeat protein
MERRKGSSRLPLWLASAAAVLLAVFGLAQAIFSRQPQQAALVQIDNAILPPNLQPINADNADQLQVLATLGNGIVFSMDVSPDGRTIAVGGALGVWLYDAADIERGVRLVEMPQAYMPVHQVKYSPDGAQLVVADNVGNLHIYDADMNEPAQIADVGAYTYDFVFTPDGEQILVGVGEEIESDEPSPVYTGYVVSLDRETLAVNVVASGESDPFHIALSPDGGTLAYVSRTKVLLQDMATGEGRQVGTTFAQPGELTFSVDGTTLLIGSGQRVRRYDVATGEELDELEAASGEAPVAGRVITLIGSSPDGTRLIVHRGGFSWLSLHDAASGGYLRTFMLPSGMQPHEVRFSPDGASIYALSDRGLYQLDAEEGAPMALAQQNNSAIASLALDNANGLVYVGEFGSNAPLVWLLVTGEQRQLGEAVLDPAFTPTLLDLSADGSRLMLTSPSDLRVLDTATGEALWEARMVDNTLINALPLAGFALDDQEIIGAALRSDLIFRWTAETGERLPRFELDRLILAADVQGQYAAVAVRVPAGGGFQQNVFILDLANDGALVAELTDVLMGEVNVVAFSTDGQRIAISEAAGENSDGESVSLTHIWNWRDGTREVPLATMDAFIINNVVFSGDGALLLQSYRAYDTRMIRLWDIAGGAVVWELPADWEVASIAFSSDNRLIITGGFDGLVRVWGVVGE